MAKDRERTEELVQGVYAQRTLVADLLDAISLVVPENVWFDSLSITTADPITAEETGGAAGAGPGDNRLSLEGRTYSFEDIAQLLVRLQLVTTLSEIDLDSAASENDEATVRSFSITAVVEGPEDPDTPLPLSQVEVEGL